MRRKLRPPAVELLTALFEALSVPYADSESDYRVREDVLNARVQDVKVTLRGVLDSPRADLVGAVSELRGWVADAPVTFVPYAGGTDETWEGE